MGLRMGTALLALILGVAVRAQAAFQISLTPVDGGEDLRFGRQDVTLGAGKELRVRITADGQGPYRVFQRLLDPFMNEEGRTLSGRALTVHSVSGSNAFGTLYLDAGEPLGFSEQWIYSSSPEGVGDGFSLVYQVEPDELLYAGRYQGRILFTVRPRDSDGEIAERVLHVFLDAPGGTNLETFSSSGEGRIVVSGAEVGGEAFVEWRWSNPSGAVRRLFQEVLTQPEDEEGRRLPAGVLLLAVTGDGGRVRGSDGLEGPSPASLVYESRSREDRVRLDYRLSPEAEAPAGRYHGRLRLSLEVGGGMEVRDYDVEVIVPPLLLLGLDFSDGDVRFDDLLPGGPEQVRRVEVRVRSNLGRPYEVVQMVADPLSDTEGHEIPSEHFWLRVAPSTDEGPGGGLLGRAPAGRVPVRPGETILYDSDAEGSPTRLRVEYHLEPYPGMTPGDYRTAIVYSLQAR